ncbi:helix-turn-helix domain-containing protein [Corynebacterium variabile]|uniref:helix-turn-helix domain-containing protein n=1 Tax=Corynebacterium variabile TaxID=1727 RepID=UPI0028B17269|nr:helix-turn-helix transcriptional regulator [Corynebacterium variabile]
MRAARKAAGLTMVQLANSAEVSQPFLSQVEHGNTMPSVINLHRIAQALDTTAHALLEQGSRAPTRIVRASEARSHNLGPAAIVRFCVTGTRLLDCNEVTDFLGAHAEGEGWRLPATILLADFHTQSSLLSHAAYFST